MSNNSTLTATKSMALMGFFGLLFALLYTFNKQLAKYGLILVLISLLINRANIIDKLVALFDMV